MNSARRQFIIQRTRRLLAVRWDSRERFSKNEKNPIDIFPLRMQIIIEDILDATYEEPPEFNAYTSLTLKVPKFETVGFIERKAGETRIVVPQNLPESWKRFTAAHEVGHMLLQTGNLYHRERPLTGGERGNFFLPSEEREANLFAAYLLMPKKVVQQYFAQWFGAPLDGRQPDADLSFWLGAGTGQTIDPLELAKRGQEYRALLVAQCSSFKTKRFIPLADRFGVSPTAMMYQLIDLGLVF